MTDPVDGNPYAAPVAIVQPRDAAFVLAGRVVANSSNDIFLGA